MAKSKTAAAAAKKAPAKSAKTAGNGKKPAAAKKAPAKRAAPAAPDRSAAIAASWADPKIRAARAERRPVKVGGEVYKSVPAAFVALGLPLTRVVRFRMGLKASDSGRAVFESDKGVKHTFVLQPAA